MDKEPLFTFTSVCLAGGLSAIAQKKPSPVSHQLCSLLECAGSESCSVACPADPYILAYIPVAYSHSMEVSSQQEAFSVVGREALLSQHLRQADISNILLLPYYPGGHRFSSDPSVKSGYYLGEPVLRPEASGRPLHACPAGCAACWWPQQQALSSDLPLHAKGSPARWQPAAHQLSRQASGGGRHQGNFPGRLEP